MSRIIAAVDPGSSSGAIAIKEQSSVWVSNMPDNPNDMLDFFRSMVSSGLTGIVCEDVGSSMPGNAAHAATTFAKHRGHLEMIFIVLGLEVTWVRPAKWMKELLGENYPKGKENKSLRKTYIYETMLKEYPDVRITKRSADALAILTWYIKKGGNK